MADTPRPAGPTTRWHYRSVAVNHHVARREQQVLPPSVAPHVFRYLWMLLGICGLGSALLSLMTVPTTARGAALAVPCGSGPALIVALPARDLARLRIGQALVVSSPAGAAWQGPVAALEAPLAGAAAAQARCGIDPALAGVLSYPAALVRLVPPGAPAPGLYTVDVRLGTHRLLSLMPVVDALLGETDK